MHLRLSPVELLALLVAIALGIVIGAAQLPPDFNPIPPEPTPTVVCPPQLGCPGQDSSRNPRPLAPPALPPQQ